MNKRRQEALVALAGGTLTVSLLAVGGALPGAAAAARRAPVAAGRSSPKIHFVDFTREAGIAFEHRSYLR